jgi:hypothetical protein
MYSVYKKTDCRVCSDPKKLDLTVVAFVAATVFIMLLHAATDIPLGLASPIVP